MINHEQVDRLLDYVGVSNDPRLRRWRGGQVNFCCPIHGESNPSCGISVDKELYHCFACGAGGSLSNFLFLSLPDDFEYEIQAIKFLRSEFGITFDEIDIEDYKRRKLVRYDDFLNIEEEQREVKPLYTIAKFKSGKETYQYFYDRGFTKQIVTDFKIGRDLESETVTVPIFWEDNTLAGVIGRYIGKRRKHERFKVYKFKKGNLLFPMHMYNYDNEECILVEGIFDAMRMYQYGYDNVFSLMTNDITIEQVAILKQVASSFIVFMDNDDMGVEGRDAVLNALKGLDVKVVLDYPEHGKDPCDWSEEEIAECLSNAKSPLKRLKIPRME